MLSIKFAPWACAQNAVTFAACLACSAQSNSLRKRSDGTISTRRAMKLIEEPAKIKSSPVLQHSRPWCKLRRQLRTDTCIFSIRQLCSFSQAIGIFSFVERTSIFYAVTLIILSPKSGVAVTRIHIERPTTVCRKPTLCSRYSLPSLVSG